MPVFTIERFNILKKSSGELKTRKYLYFKELSKNGLNFVDIYLEAVEIKKRG